MRSRMLLTTVLGLAFAAPASATTPLLRLDGFGPLKMGMSRTAGLATGWLRNKRLGCELEQPRGIVYDVKGKSVPSGVVGTAQFNSGKLTNLSFSGGVHTAAGVVPGKSPVSAMVKAYRARGFHVSARYESTFQGTFVTVKRKTGGATVLSGFAGKGNPIEVLSLTMVPVCE